MDTPTVTKTEATATVHDLHKRLLKIAYDEIQRLPEHLEHLTPAERVRFVLAVLPYTAPRVDKVGTNYAEDGGAFGW